MPIEARPTASIPGTITRAGSSIFGTAAMSGVRRAAPMFFAAIARWTTRKLVHQYPKDSTKPRPNTIEKMSTPIGLAEGPPRSGVHALDQASGAKVWSLSPIFAGAVATVASCSFSRPQPPTSLRPSQTTGAKPRTIMKNCSTSV